MADDEYREAIRREMWAQQQLAALRLEHLEQERLEQERYEQESFAMRQMALDRPFPMLHRSGAPMYYLETPAHPGISDDFWSGTTMQPPLYDPWQSQQQQRRLLQQQHQLQHQLEPRQRQRLQPQAHSQAQQQQQQPPQPNHRQQSQSQLQEPQRHEYHDPMRWPTFPAPVIPVHTFRTSKDSTFERHKNVVASRADRSIARSKQLDRPSIPVIKMASPTVGATSEHSEAKAPATKPAKLKLPINPKPKSKPVKRERSITSTKPTPAPKKPSNVTTRPNWEELRLGKVLGTPAYNAHQRAKHEEQGLPPPQVLTALELTRKIASIRVRSVYLPTDSPLQQVEETSNLDEQVRDRSREKVVAIKASTDSWSTKQHKETIKQSESDMDVVMETLGAYLKRTTSRERERDDDNKSESDKGANQDDKTREAVPREMLDHSTLLHHALGRLYHTMQCQDADDYSTDHQKSNDWTVQDVKAKLESFENDIEELERREQQIVKESKQLNVTNIGILEEAYRLLGVVPPKGC